MGQQQGPTFGSLLDNQFGTGNPFRPNPALPMAGGNMIQQGGANIATGAGMAGGASGALGNLAGMSTGNQWYGNSPIATAEAASQRALGKNLASLRERYGAMGLGRGSDVAQAEGTAIGESTTGLGAQLAQIGVGARNQDIQNAISAQGQAGQLGLGVGNLGVGGANAGTGIIGAANQQNQTALDALLGAGNLGLQNRNLDANIAGQLGNQGSQLTGIGANEQAPMNMNAILALLGGFAGGSTTGGGGSSSKTGPPGIG